MPGFRDLIVQGVSLANTLTPDLQVSAAIHRAGAKNQYGDPTYELVFTGTGLLSHKSGLVRSVTGREVKYDTKLVIMQSVQVSEGDLCDCSDLDSGGANRVIAVSGLVDPDTSKPYLTSVYIG